MNVGHLIWDVETGEIRLGDQVIHLPADMQALRVTKQRADHMFTALWIDQQHIYGLYAIFTELLATWKRDRSRDALHRINLFAPILRALSDQQSVTANFLIKEFAE